MLRTGDGLIAKRAGKDDDDGWLLESDHPAWEPVPWPDDAGGGWRSRLGSADSRLYKLKGKLMARNWAVLGLLALGACATIVEGDDQTVSVITAPPEASCELTRGGTAVAFVNPTPGSVVLEKSNDNVSVLCKKMGHFDGAGTLASSFKA